MNEIEIKEALKIIKQPIIVNCTDYKYFDEENYNKLISVYENCLWIVNLFEQAEEHIEHIQQENQQLKDIIEIATNHIRTCCNMDSKWTNLHFDYAQNEMSSDQVDELLEILKGE